MYLVFIGNFHSILGWYNHKKVCRAIFDCNIRSSVFVKQHSRDYIKFWRRGDQQSSLKHLEVNIQNLIFILWVEEFLDMVHFIIINWFDRSGFWIWNRFIVRFNWKLLRLNLNITIINGMMIKYPHDSWNHRIFWGGEVLDLKWAYVGCLFRYLGGSVGSSPWRALNLFIFLIILGGANLGP